MMAAESRKNSGDNTLSSPIIQSRPLQPIPIELRTSGASVWIPQPWLERRERIAPKPDGTHSERTESCSSLRMLEPLPVEKKTKKKDGIMSTKLKKGGVVNYNILRENASFSDSSHSMSASYSSSNKSSSILFTQGETISSLGTVSGQSTSFPTGGVHAWAQMNGGKPTPLSQSGTIDRSEAMGIGGSYHSLTQPNSSSLIGFMEGPLPSEVREIIRTYCSPDRAEEAEKEARRLLSTSRRLKVFRAEMKAAMEELADATVEKDRQELVAAALREEVEQLSEKIQALQKEKSICEEQILQVQEVGIQRQKKLSQANERVQLLKNTIDNITRETSMAHLFLLQAVPNLNIENYA